MMELLGLIAFCVVFIVLWGVAGEILKNRGVASGSGIGFAIGFLTAITIFRTNAVISNNNLDATIYDVLFWLTCLGSWIYVGYMYKKDKVILSNAPQEVGNWLLKGSIDNTKTFESAKSDSKKPSGWALLFIFIGTPIAFFTMGFMGLIIVFAFAILWRIVITLEEIRDNQKRTKDDEQSQKTKSP